MQRRRGFTLIEILIVIAIIAVLALQVTPQLIGFDKEARVATTKGNLNTLRTRVTMFRAKTGDYPDNLQDLLTEKYYDAGVQRPYLKSMPKELISSKEGSNNLEVLSSSEDLSNNGGWTYIKDTADVVIDVSVPLSKEWEAYEGQVPSEW